MRVISCDCLRVLVDLQRNEHCDECTPLYESEADFVLFFFGL